MNSILRHFAAVAALTLSSLALAGSALAAPPSAPPGQEQANAPAEHAAAPAQENAAAREQKQAEQAPKASTSAAANSSTSSHGINSTSSGVKPSTDTKKRTSCRTGGSMPSPSCSATTSGSVSTAATSDHSKRYGNQKTAAQIAVSRGGVGIEVRGPGNSQPHKVCGKNGNWVDVHAVKNYAGVCAAATTTTTTTQLNEVRTTLHQPLSTSGPVPAAAAAAGSAQAAPAGGVAGVAAAAPAGGAGGVAGAFAEIGGVAGEVLPFTGFPLWAVVLIAIAAVVIGLTLRHGGRAASTRVAL
jgi:hypothetical protein